MASASATEPGAPSAPLAVPQVCPHCRKSFPRLCDLNKHAKSHSRPFKCSVPNCKYHQRGWPTAKELERHVNDKHSLAPRTYACAYESCSYESKRESNCKQHMEKKHGWEYVRSKSNGKRLPVPQALVTPVAIGPVTQQPADLGRRGDAATQITLLSPKSPSPHHFDSDFILFPESHDQPVGLGRPDEDHRHSYEDDDEDDESRVFIPWTSPATRMLKNQSVLDMFTETYNRPPEKPLDHDAMIDPTLQHFNDAAMTNWQKAESDRTPAVNSSVKTEPSGLGMDGLSWYGGSETGSAPDDSPSDQRNPSTAYSSQFHTPHSAAADYAGPPAHPGQMGWTKPPLRRRGSDEGNQRPDKKLKASPVEEFTDNNMPDIFRFAHPTVYDRDQKEKYSPCHSSHRDISTLVRHLGRPAHRLTVTKEAISSFEIPDDDYRHPRIGVCRRCWRRFTERHTFEEHAAGSCEKISKGKREKWQILHDSFTPLLDSTPATDKPAEPPLEHGNPSARGGSMQSPDGATGFLPANVDEASWNHAPVPSGAVTSPTTTSFAPLPALSTAPGEPLVSAQEYARLRRERNDLQQRNQQLERMLAGRAVLAAGSAAQSSSLATMHTRNPPGSRITLVSGAAVSRPAASVSATDPQGALPDRDKLVLHMGSKPEDVDIHGLMNEPQENLSRQNSGTLSITRSTIHHVTTSPPQRLVEYEEGAGGKGAALHGTANPGRNPCPSIPDSGYSSAGHHRHGSFGDISHMPGIPQHQHGHQQSFSNVPAMSYPQPRTSHDTGAHGEVLQDPGVSWRPILYPAPAPTSTPGQGLTAQYQQDQTHTFLPEQTPAQGEGMENFFPDFLNLDNI